MAKLHDYVVNLRWTGNQGTGTNDYRAYERSHEIQALDKPVIAGSSDPSFRGDRSRYNPEELLVASISSCHMLWYLHLCAEAGVVVLEYSDEAKGKMEEDGTGGGKFSSVTLYPRVLVSEASMSDKATALHELANSRCFIANSLNFKVGHKPLTLSEK